MSVENSTASGLQCRSAVVALVRVLVLHLAVAEAVLTPQMARALLGVAVYVAGLILLGPAATTCAIASALPLLSHDALTRMLVERWWTRRALQRVGVSIANRLGGGWLILDDVLIPKPYAKAISWCVWDYDHASRRNAFGIRLVVLVWCNGSVTIPLGFFIWQKDPTRTPRPKKKKRGRKPKRKPAQTPAQKRKAARAVRTARGDRFRSKNDLARILVWEAVRAGIDADVILFDNWYASRKNLRFFTRLGLEWGTRLKKNTVVTYQGQRLTVGEVARAITKTNYHYYAALGARARSFEVHLFGLAVHLTVVQDDTHAEADRVKYLATTMAGLTCRERVQWYRRRWPIECFFRDSKQVLGLSACQAREAQAVLTHIVLVCVASVVLQMVKPIASGPRLSVTQSRHALVMLRVLVLPDGFTSLVLLTSSGQVLPIDLDQLWSPVRTRLSGISLPKSLEFP